MSNNKKLQEVEKRIEFLENIVYDIINTVLKLLDEKEKKKFKKKVEVKSIE